MSGASARRRRSSRLGEPTDLRSPTGSATQCELLERLGAIAWRADPATLRFTSVSSQAETLLGYPASRWLEDPDFWATLVHPDDLDWTLRSCAPRAAVPSATSSIAASTWTDGCCGCAA